MRISDCSSDVCAADLGLLDELTKVHTLHIIDTEDVRRYRFNDGVFADGTPAPRDGSIIDGLKMLASAKAICGHNIIPFDIPALVKVYPWFRLHPECIVWDTLVYARLVYPHLKQIDQAAMKKRSEERRDGKECVSTSRYRWSPCHQKK